MIDVAFDIRIDESGGADDPWLDEYELAQMMEHTKAQIMRQVQEKLGSLSCPTHGSPVRVVVSGAYARATEQLDLSYHIDACCPHFLILAVAALNR